MGDTNLINIVSASLNLNLRVTRMIMRCEDTI